MIFNRAHNHFESLTVVYPPAIDYKFMHQRPHQIMKALAQAGANVIFINPANIFPQKVPLFKPFFDLPNFTVIHKDYDFKHLLKGKVIFWCAVNQEKFLDEYEHDFAVFDSCDLAEDEFSMWKDLIPKMERKTNLTVASAMSIYNEHSSRGVDTVLIPNGADFEHFRKAINRLERPVDIPYLKEPIIGYYGAIYSWLDTEMLYSIANKYKVVLIGSNKFYDIPINHSNIIKLNMKSYEILPHYLSWFDVCLIPFKLTKMIEGCNPVKLYEYLSAGKPVVATKMKELTSYSDLVYFADARSASSSVEQALEKNNLTLVNRRQAFAKENTWLNRAKKALHEISKRL